MARSSASSETPKANQAGAWMRLNSPKPLLSASMARPTAVMGKVRRTRKVSSATTARLLGQRKRRGVSWFRRGAAHSHAAIQANVPKKKARRMDGSFASRNRNILKMLLLEKAFYYTFNLSIE